mmetsp:Transcript_9574/g.20720  ORF Transcript_9574/g.20720 Transcript_9574/m.20720 type:complete len:119 (+) Transcript_9574:1685-2041(+)
MDTEVSRASGSNDSTSHAHIGEPHIARLIPSPIWEKKAIHILLLPKLPITNNKIGPAQPKVKPPTVMTRRLPTKSDNTPASGNQMPNIKILKEFTKNADGTGGVIKSCMKIAIQTNDT